MVNLQRCPKKEGFCEQFFATSFWILVLHAKSEGIFSTLANSYWLLYYWLLYSTAVLLATVHVQLRGGVYDR